MYAGGQFEIGSGGRRYIASTMREPLLERGEERALAERWRDAADPAALHALTRAYARFVVRIACGFRGYGLPLNDLIQEGNIGLMEAAARFDPGRDVRFSTYASWWIVAAIQDYVLRNTSIVRVATSPAMRRLFFNLRRLRARTASGADGTLSDADRLTIARILDVSVADVSRMEAHLSGADSSLDGTVAQADGTRLSILDRLADERPGPEDSVMAADMAEDRRRRLQAVIAGLPARERRIIRQRFYAKRRQTLEAIGVTLGVSKERVRQLEAKALARLRAALGDPDLLSAD